MNKRQAKKQIMTTLICSFPYTKKRILREEYQSVKKVDRLPNGSLNKRRRLRRERHDFMNDYRKRRTYHVLSRLCEY